MNFTITTAGDENPTYRWQQNGADLNPLPQGVFGEATANLRIENVMMNHQGQYRCIVSNAAGNSITSDPAQLTVRKFLYLNCF